MLSTEEMVTSSVKTAWYTIKRGLNLSIAQAALFTVFVTPCKFAGGIRKALDLRCSVLELWIP